MKKLLVVLSFIILTTSIQASIKHDLINNWQFIRQDMANAWEVFRPIKPGNPESVPIWKEVTIPHCFNATEAVDPDTNYYEGAGWYRTYLEIDNPYPNGRTFLEFEGSGQKTDVYVYTKKVGSHTGGYDKWRVDISDAVAAFVKTDICKSLFKGRVPIAIRCDNGRDIEMIPSDMSDFNLYGGIYRPLHLTYAPKVSIENVHIIAKNHEVDIKTWINGSFQDVSAHVKILAPNGETVGYEEKDTLHSSIFSFDPIHIKDPVLWDVNNPHLYTAVVTIMHNGTEDVHRVQFGFRTYDFKKHGPFYLNGRRLLLRGTHRHEDHAGVGAAMTDEMILHEMQQIKDMGANFIRLGHYQQSERVLQLCDSLGILVWEEIPWCRGGLGGKTYRAQARRMLTNLINQHYNHPAVILWGLGNENDWQGDFPTFSKDSIRMFMSELNTLAHQIDPSRKTTIRRCDFCSDIVDVYSPSIWAGWYSGSFFDYRKLEEDAIAKFPHFFHAEWGGDSYAGRHSESNFKGLTHGDKNSDWSETYIVKLFDWILHEQLTMPNLTGSAFWTFKDFSTPLRPNNPIPYVNMKGVVTRDGTPKESYYVFQSYWTTKPMIHLYGHSWPVRWGQKNKKEEICVYSNCDKVELFLNSKSVGIKKRNLADYPATGFHWNVILKEGKNDIKAVGYSKDKIITDEIHPEYQTEIWGVPVRLALSSRKINDKTVEINVQLIDNKNIRCLDATNWIRFELSGDGKLITNLGTPNASSKIQCRNGRATIRAIVTGKAIIAVKSSNLPTAFIEIK